jgi:hypothetical protein
MQEHIQEQVSIQFQELANINIEKISKEELIDVSASSLDITIPHEERARHICQTVKNPYCFRVGDMGVKLEFSDNAPGLQDIFTDFLIRKKSGI